MQLVRVPIVAVLVLIAAALLAMLAQMPAMPTSSTQPELVISETLFMWQAQQSSESSKQAITSQRAQQAGLTISEGGSFDPNDLCKQYNAAFRAAGVPNACTAIVLYYSRPEIAVVHFHKGEELVASVDYGVDWSDSYQMLQLPKGHRVWQTALRVYKPFTGKGIGQAIVRNYEILLRASGAQTGDIQLLIASPDKKVMLPQAASAWEDFIAQLCIEWGATPINSISPKVGCWRFLP